MSTKKARLLSAAMAGGLLLTGVTAAAIANRGHAPTHATLAANMAPLPPVNLDNCPILESGYVGGCVNQLQAELNSLDNAGLPVDGIFGQETRQAVITFQQDNGIPADGIVGPATKQALDTNLSTPTTAGLGQTQTSGGPTTSSPPPPPPEGSDSSPSGSSEIADGAAGALACGVGGWVLGVVTVNPILGDGADVACEVIGHDVLGGNSPDPAG